MPAFAIIYVPLRKNIFLDVVRMHRLDLLLHFQCKSECRNLCWEIVMSLLGAYVLYPSQMTVVAKRYSF